MTRIFFQQWWTGYRNVIMARMLEIFGGSFSLAPTHTPRHSTSRYNYTHKRNACEKMKKEKHRQRIYVSHMSRWHAVLSAAATFNNDPIRRRQNVWQTINLFVCCRKELICLHRWSALQYFRPIIFTIQTFSFARMFIFDQFYFRIYILRFPTDESCRLCRVLPKLIWID